MKLKGKNVDVFSFNFFRNLPRDNKQFAVIGLGRFGKAVCSTLQNLGYEVLGIDVEKKRVSQILSEQLVTHALQLDSTEPAALKQAGIFELTTVIVAIGNYLQESIITTLNLKEAGVPYVVAKASSEIHSKLLQKVGADYVVYPEHEAGSALARSLTQPSIIDRFDLDPDYSIVELILPNEFQGKTIADLQLGNRYGLNLLAVSQDGKLQINPDPTMSLTQGSTIVVIGSNRDINRLLI